MRDLQTRLKEASSEERAKKSLRFFKTGKGEYGEHEHFIGVAVPTIREIVRSFYHLTLEEVSSFLQSEVHEERFAALLIWIKQFSKKPLQKMIHEQYLSHTKFVNNWDLVDLSAPILVGSYVLDKDKTILYKLAESKILWDRRIAMVATKTLIKHKLFEDTLCLAEILLQDKEDLIQKAVGWMLKEMGDHDPQIVFDFLAPRMQVIPRTTFRYATEKIGWHPKNV